MKKCARKKCRNMFLEAFFSHSRKLFSKFPYKIFVIALHEIIGLQNFSLSFCKSKSRITMCNLHWCYTFCTGVTLFAPVLHFLHWCYTWTALLSANQNRVIFSCVLLHRLFLFASHGFILGRGIYNVPQQRPECVALQKGNRLFPK